MAYTKITQLTLAIALIVSSTFALAGPAVNMRFEAAATCGGAGCLENMTSAGGDGLRGLLNQVNIIVAENRVAVAPVKENHAKAITGSITTNQLVPDMHDPRKLVKTGATAFMISPCHAITNFHAVFGRANEGDTTHTITMTIQGTRKYSVIGKPVAYGSFKRNEDWAVVELDKCVGADPMIGWGVPANSNSAQNVVMSSFPGDKDRNQLWASQCDVHNVWPDHTFTHDCASRSGSSGSPIFTTAGSGVPQILGLNLGEVKSVDGIVKQYDESVANTAILYSTIYPQVRSFVDSAISQFSRENPQVTMARQHNNAQVAQAQSI